MKRIFFVACVAMAAVACGGNESSSTTQTTVTPAEERTAAPADELSSNPDYKNGLALVAKSDCLTCHKVSETSTGPSYKDVAAKYPNADDATVTMLAEKIIKGGSGNWGQIPMTPHPTVSIDDAKQMVKYVLLLNK